MLGHWSRSCPRSRLRWLCWPIILLTASAFAQPPEVPADATEAEEFTAAQVQPVEQPPEPLSTDQPTPQPAQLPETEVQGRLNTFPAEPLPAGDVISPTRTPQPAATTASSVTVITREQIERSGQTNVAEVLRGTLGVDVVRQGGPGGLTSVFLRGANSQHTKVLLDGISLNDPSNASRLFDFSTLTTDNIERIEVLRGPQSMAYGSDAIGGVINIISRRGQGPLSVRAGGLGGSFKTGQTSVNVQAGDDNAYYSVTGSFLSTGRPVKKSKSSTSASPSAARKT